MTTITKGVAMMIEPITPDKVERSATKPDEVIDAFNELIQKYWDGDQAKFKLIEAVELISIKLGNIGTRFVYENHYLDIEHIYRQAGWEVYYDKPGYNESYPPTFTFSRRQ